MSRTALLVVDPYNDFLAEGGKLWPRLATVANEVGALDNMRAVLAAAREVRLAVFIVPHHRSTPGDFAHWRHATPYQLGASALQVFAAGSFGGEWHPDFAPRANEDVVQEHWGSDGFAGTDLDRRLRQRGIERVVLIGMIANTCIESTARHAVELGFHVTLVRDATAAFSAEAMRAAHDIDAPSFAHAVVTAAEWCAQVRSSTSRIQETSP
ncbi:MAG: cysteine hydrolase [Planctomycetes bacterium]|nr:cysteine hydrolase [Planctomycetota bacterium]